MTVRTAFFGTPEAAIPTLAALHASTGVTTVVTRPDRPAGRGRLVTPSPVGAWATHAGLPVLQPTRSELGHLDLGDIDVAVVVAYGAIIGAELLAQPRHGFVNVHFSRLPRWRGAAPVQRALLAGDEEVGVSIMVLDAGLDTGPVLATAAVEVGERTAGDLTNELAVIGAGLLTDVLPGYLGGSVAAVPQDDHLATIAPKLTPADGQLDPSLPAETLARNVRALTPSPGAWIETPAGRLKVLVASHGPGTAREGEVAVDACGWPVLGTADGDLVLTTVQPAGKRPMAGQDWARGRPAGLGDRR